MTRKPKTGCGNCAHFEPFGPTLGRIAGVPAGAEGRCLYKGYKEFPKAPRAKTDWCVNHVKPKIRAKVS